MAQRADSVGLSSDLLAEVERVFNRIFSERVDGPLQFNRDAIGGTRPVRISSCEESYVTRRRSNIACVLCCSPLLCACYLSDLYSPPKNWAAGQVTTV